MPLSYKQLRKLVSGHTVYRVLIYGSNVDMRTRKLKPLTYDAIEARHLCGKKILHMFSSTRRTLRIVAKDKPGLTWRAARVRRDHFLDDLRGTACFDTIRKARRFVDEINAGLHPAVVDAEIKLAIEHRDFEIMMNSIADTHD